MVCHDHNVFPEDLEDMRRGGVTAKQVHVSLDSRIWADKAAYLASRTEEIGFAKRALVAIDYLYWQVEQSPDRLMIALTPLDILEAKRTGRAALLLGSEGARLIEGRLELLRMFHRLGLRHVQLTWAWHTAVGTPQSDTSGRGLTDYGRDLIREMNRLGMIVDVSHLSYASIYDALDVSNQPVLNSHSGAAALNPGNRQLMPDDLLIAIAKRGGVVAVHFMSHLVKPGREQARLEQLLDQFAHIADLVGTDHVACGPDYAYEDPRWWQNQDIPVAFSFTEGVENIRQLSQLTRGLVARGFCDEDIRKIMGGNLLHLFQNVHEGADRGQWEYRRYREGIGACTEGTTPL
jgi:membrane dipeptidase